MEQWLDWQKPYFHGVLVIWPPEPVRSKVNQLRQAYDPVSRAICEAHITLTQPFLDRPTKMDWSALAGIASSLAPIEIAYGPLNAFFPNPVIYFEIQPADRLLEMRRVLHDTGLFNLALAYTEGFVPHMTVTESLSEIKADEELLTKLRERVSGGSFSCSWLSYIVPDAKFNFRVARRLKLGR